MCGIAGFSGARPVAPDLRQAMLDALARRGPDARHSVAWDGAWRRDDAQGCHALLHARLSIIDPRPIADQPMANDTGDIWLCYNGEVYGWQDDARALEERGARFRTRSDTEFILRAYEAWGLDMLPRLRGMFAFGLLDLRRRKLFLVRDRMGLKPLVYCHRPGEIGFASTVRALLPFLPAERRAFDTQGIDAFLAHRYIPAPRTAFRDIRRLPNGHALEYDLDAGTLRETTYWEPAAEAADWRATLDEAIRLRTVADRPVGIFLSGGIDSALLASRLATLGYKQLRTYTATFPGDPMDEGPDAARTAALLGLPHTEVEIPASIRESFARIVADLDEPFADPSAFPMWHLARAATREVKVALAGDGGDELFAGYKRYRAHLRSAWRRGLVLPFKGDAGAMAPSRWSRLRLELSLPWEDAYGLRFSGFSPMERRRLQPELGGEPAVYWRAPDVRHGAGALDALLAIDMANYLPEYILRKGDLTTMAHGLELRAPLLDHQLYRRILAMPARARFTRPAKLALEPLLGACRELGLFRRDKRGFNPPLARWLREDLAERLDTAGERLQAASGGQVSAAGTREIVARYRSGESRLAERVLQLAILAESLDQLRAIA
jgi:asparagine synthase (glutamine-hydrolysing)